MSRQSNRNRQSSDDITAHAANGTWLNAILNAASLMVVSTALLVAIGNYGVNRRTLMISEKNLDNNLKNAENTTEIINQLKFINEKLERM